MSDEPCPPALGVCTMCGKVEATVAGEWPAPVCADCNGWLTSMRAALDASEKTDPELGRLAGEVADAAFQAGVEDPERRWKETLSCGHVQQVTTVIGDLDFAALHAGLPVMCTVCRYDLDRPVSDCFVELVSVRAVPREEWDD